MSVWYSSPRTQDVQEGTWVHVPVWLGGPGRPVHVPLRPIWDGIALNAACLALFGWSLTVGRRRLLRRIRAARGRCLRCGYRLEGLPAGAACPECGKEANTVASSAGAA